MPDADDVDGRAYAEQRAQRVDQVRERACGRLADEQVALLAVGEGVLHEVDGVGQRHHEARHLGVGHRDRPAVLELPDE